VEGVVLLKLKMYVAQVVDIFKHTIHWHILLSNFGFSVLLLRLINMWRTGYSFPYDKPVFSQVTYLPLFLCSIFVIISSKLAQTTVAITTLQPPNLSIPVSHDYLILIHIWDVLLHTTYTSEAPLVSNLTSSKVMSLVGSTHWMPNNK
jgi:hypothetical protein